METDVYAFGCLYYAVSLLTDPSASVTRLVQIFFNAIPYAAEPPFLILTLVTSATHPPRLETPKMKESLWKLINDCWKFRASERPTMNRIVDAIKLFITPAQGSHFQRHSEFGHSTMAQVLETPFPSLPATYQLPTTASSSLPATSVSSPSILALLPVPVPPLPETFQSLLSIAIEVLYTLLKCQCTVTNIC